MMSLALLACGPSFPDATDRAAYVEALKESDGRAIMAKCEDAGPLLADCVIKAVEASPRDEHAGSWCDRLSGTSRDECRFQLAERRDDLAACADAGSYADDCRLHVFSRGLPDLWTGDFAAGVGAVRAKMAEVGIPADDYRFWSAAFRHGLLRTRPFDRSACSAAGDPALVDACRHTALAVYQDLLNHERDFGHFPCDGGPLPASVAYVPDPDIDAILADRRPRDLCPGLQ
jgi:hypothetical protein